MSEENQSNATAPAGSRAAPGSAAALCKRCGQPFKPKFLKSLKRMSECCEICGVRNICDGLELPTPPELLDRYTKRPALTRRDLMAQLAADDEQPNVRTERGPENP